MKIPIYKFIWDTDVSTGCNLFFLEEKAVGALYSCAISKGYSGPAQHAAISDWLENLSGNVDTHFIQAEVLDIPTPTELADKMIEEIERSAELRICRSFSELHDHCDANLLGGAEDLLEQFPMEVALRLLNAAQQLVTEYLSAWRYWIVVGHQPEGESTIWTGPARGQSDAIDKFEDQLCEDDGNTRADLRALGGAIIEYTGWSNQPITT